MAEEQLLELQKLIEEGQYANDIHDTADKDGEFKITSAIAQFGLGAINEALLGFPQWLIDKEKEGLFKEEDTKGERFARGLGSFVGFIGLPAGVFIKGGKLGGKLALKGLLKAGGRKAAKKGALAIAAARGAAGFGAYELLHAPEKEYKEKLATIPMAAALGGSLGVAGGFLGPIVKKHSKKLYNNIVKKGSSEEYENIIHAMTGESAKLIRKADKKFLELLDSNKYGEARTFMNKVFTGVKYNIAKARLNASHTNYIQSHPKLQKMMQGNLDKQVLAQLKNVVPNKELNKTKDFYLGLKKLGQDIVNNPFTTNAGKIVNQMGEGGKAIFNNANIVRNSTEKLSGKAASTYKIVTSGMKPEEKLLLTDYLEGRKLIGGMKFVNANENIRREFAKVAALAKKIGVKVTDKTGELRQFIPKKDFFPHYGILPGTDKKIQQEVLKAAVKRGEFKNLETAQIFLNKWFDDIKFGVGKKSRKFIEWYANRNRISEDKAEKLLNTFVARTKMPKFAHIEHSRVAPKFPFWDPNPDRVLPRYFTGAYNRLNEIRIWNQDDSVFNALVAKVKKDGYDSDFLVEIQKRFSGASARERALGVITPEMSQRIRNFEVVTKLGLASIPNATQSTNTALVAGTRRTAKQISKILTDKKFREESYKYGLDIGASLQSALNDFMSGKGMSSFISSQGLAQKMLRFTGFIKLEQFNRVVSANVARDYMIQNSKRLLKNPADKIAKRRLQELGVNVKNLAKRGHLKWNEIIHGSQLITNKTQFRAGPLDLPLWMSSPTGKIVSQFKSFAFNQAKLVKDLLKDEVARGNMKPIIAAVTLMPILGEGVKNLRGLLTGQVRDEKGMDRLLENISSVGGAGMVNDMFQAVKYNNMAGYLAGPFASDVGRGATGIIKATKGKPKPLQRFLLRNTPIVGPALKNAMLPSTRLKGKRNKLLKAKMEKELGRELTKKEFNKLRKQ